ncbi:MAG: hypothetical protein NTU48_02225 [Legionellales bacterium]|nr:hypothetical protein [Legionellales bacterium]
MTIKNKFFPDHSARSRMYDEMARAELPSYTVFERASGPCILSGLGLITLGVCLALLAGATMTGLGLVVAGAGIVGYGIYLGMQALKAHAEMEFTIDIEPLGQPIETCWERFVRVMI